MKLLELLQEDLREGHVSCIRRVASSYFVSNVTAKRPLWGAKCFYCTDYICMFEGQDNGPHGSDPSSKESKCVSFAPLNRQMNLKLPRLKLMFYEQTMKESSVRERGGGTFCFILKNLKYESD